MMKYLWEIWSVKITSVSKNLRFIFMAWLYQTYQAQFSLIDLFFNIELNFFFRTIKHYDFKMEEY